MQYAKPALTFEQQAQRLIERGMIVEDRALLVQRLSAVSYYRLSAYWFPYKQPGESFLPGTSFEHVWRIYCFDRRLRLVVMDAIDWIEIAILRTRMVEQFTLLHGPFGYTDKANFDDKFSLDNHLKMMDEIDTSVKYSKEVFVKHFTGKYVNEPHLPLWMAAELMSFGNLFTFFRHMHRPEKQTLATACGVAMGVLDSWLHTLNFARNTCAHHARLWNRELPIRPMVPDKKNNPEWHQPSAPDNRFVFSVLTLLKFLLTRLAPQSQWQIRFQALLDEFREIPLKAMGFPPNWQDSPIWKNEA